MTVARGLHLAVFASAGPVSGGHGGWRHPAQAGDFLTAEYYAGLGRLLEAGLYDMLFVADILAVPDRLEGSTESQLRHGALGALRLDPMVVLSAVAATTRHIGLACTISTTYFEPYAVARAMASLDHISGGRAAWNIVTSFQEAEARNFGRDTHAGREQRYERADEFLEVTCKLWDSWQDDALVRDRAAPLFADPSKVRAIDHEGRYFQVRGPLNVSRPPQGRPVLVQAGASDRGRDFAARWAEVIFITPPSIEAAREFRADLRARADRFGRDPDGLRVLAGIQPVAAATQAEAEAERGLLERLAHPRAGLSTLAYHLDVDLSLLPQDEVLPETLEVPGVQGHLREVAEMTRKTGMPLSRLGQRYGAGRMTPPFTGTGVHVADSMQQWFEAGACDGFMLQIPYLPGGLESFTRHVVPELQRRGLYRRAYDGTTLRGHLGLKRP